MRTLFLATLFVVSGVAHAQAPSQPSLNYTLAELRFVDVDVSGGDGFKLAGSYRLEGNWLMVGSLTSLGFDGDVDTFTIDIGGGYVWPYRADWDLLATVRYVNIDVDTPSGSGDDSGIGITGGVRGMLAPQFEVRGAVSHVSVGDGDTFLEIAGDYYFTDNFAAGLSAEVAGDIDTFSIGARWFFH